MNTNLRIEHGDCLALLPTMQPDSVDSIVTDPPYHLTTGKKGGTGPASVNLNSPAGRARITAGFMGKAWDGGDIAHQPEVWEQALRVAKPGAHLLAFGGTRTFHRLALAIEDAGWEIRDTIMWVYGSGFPKSLNLDGKHDGWGTALKPAWEPIIVARKPIDGTVAENMQKHGTGALNIDGCRIAVDPEVDDMLREVTRKPRESQTWEKGSGFKNETNPRTGVPSAGRWPANLVHDGSEEVLARFPEDAGGCAPASGPSLRGENVSVARGVFNGLPTDADPAFHGDTGSAARFFYCAKADRDDRNEGCEGLKRKPLNWSSGEQNPGSFQADGTDRTSPNHHPTVKPTDLMRWLCRLVTPPGGLVLDPFMGSGSTGKAALLEGFRFCGMEREAEYVEIAKRRIVARVSLFAQSD